MTAIGGRTDIDYALSTRDEIIPRCYGVSAGSRVG